MKTFFDCWVEVAGTLFSQALAGEPELSESLPRPLGANAFGWAAILAGEVEGRFAVVLDGALLEASLVGDGVEQKSGWRELVRETLDAAAGELLVRVGQKCQIVRVEEIGSESQVTRAFQIRSGDRSWSVLVRDELRAREAGIGVKQEAESSEAADQPEQVRDASIPAPPLSPGLELLLDVELEASLRFGAREMLLGEILDLGPGDVVELDRHVADPVDLIVGDKIVARGEVVLVNGNFGLRVSEVAAPRKRLESVRCLF